MLDVLPRSLPYLPALVYYWCISVSGRFRTGNTRSRKPCALVRGLSNILPLLGFRALGHCSHGPRRTPTFYEVS